VFDTTYRHVEAALVQTYGVPGAAIPTFRSRLGNLQKQGLFGRDNMPGRGGAAMRYGPDQFHRLIFACEMSEVGIGPATVLELVELLWKSKLVTVFREAEHIAFVHNNVTPRDVILNIGGVRLMTGEWSGDSAVNVNSCTLADLPKRMEDWMKGGGSLPARVLVVNLSSRLREFQAALERTHPEEMARERAEAKARVKRKKK
jgi:hypothetical protein